MTDVSVSSITDFYRRHENKVILVIIVFLSMYLLMIAAKLTWSLVPAPQLEGGSSQPSIISPSSNNNNSNINIKALTNLNLFGDAAAQPPAQIIQQVSDVPETKLNLVLSGVVSSTDESKGAAIIEYRNNQNTYGLGDKVEGTNVTLDEILSDRVIIKNRLTRETLMLEGLDYDEANRQIKNQATAQSQQNSPQRVAPNNNSEDLRARAKALREARQKLSTEPANFTDFIALAPHRVDGQLVGFRVSPGKEPALFNSVGLKNGDVVLQLNGLDLTDLQQSGEAITQLQQADTLQLEVLRSGEFVSLELDIPRN